jgi:hypothetical protein
MIEFLGKTNFKGLNIYTFQYPPLLNDQKPKKSMLSESVDFVSSFFDYGEIYFSFAQILQWFHFTNNDKKTKALYFHDKVIMKNENHSIVIHESFGDNRKILVVRKSGGPDEGPVLLNEYHMGLYCTNPMRCYIPHFAFYYFANLDSTFYIYQEYIKDGMTYDKYLNGNFKLEDFLSIYLQVLLALEFGQNYSLFSHNDLHAENLLLRPNTLQDQRIIIPLYGKEYVFEKSNFVPTFIDFGYATGNFDATKIISVTDLFPQFGYFPFFISGSDIIKITVTVFIKMYKKNDAKSKQITEFIGFILKNFFQLDTNVLIQQLGLISKQFYNFSPFRIIYSTPMELFEFLQKNKTTVLKILKLSDFPFHVKLQTETATKYRKVKHQKKEKPIIQSFQDIFSFQCVQNFCKNSHLRPRYFSSSETDTKKNAVKSNSPYTEIENVPLLVFDNQIKVMKFLKLFKSFISYYERSYREYFYENEKEPSFFSSNFTKVTKFYRCLKTLEYYVNYLKQIETKQAALSRQNENYRQQLKKLYNGK